MNRQNIDSSHTKSGEGVTTFQHKIGYNHSQCFVKYNIIIIHCTNVPPNKDERSHKFSVTSFTSCNFNCEKLAQMQTLQ